MFNFSIFFILSIGFLIVSSQQQQQDDLCPRIITVICVKDEFSKILLAAKEINEIFEQIEKFIIQQESIGISLEKFIDHEMKNIQSIIPSKYHHNFNHIDSNINRTGLINLLKEEYYAFIYLYNSIENLLKIENILTKSFKKIEYILRNDILCNYRNIFYIYSQTWLTINEINGIQILKTHKRAAPSFLYNSYSIIISKLFQEWFKNLDNFVMNVGQKLMR